MEEKDGLQKKSSIGSASIYAIRKKWVKNRYFVVSSPEAGELILKPETVGYTCLQCLQPPTQAFMRYLSEQEKLTNLHIFNILRGGLNFPLEEACHNMGVRVCNTDFVTCERVIVDGIIKGLDIRYEKIIAEKGVTLLIGDIVASGETLMECIPLIAKRYQELGGSIRKIVFFTIGGSKAIVLMERLTDELRNIWPDFVGFDCIFYEGMFTVYEDNGVTGINTPDIDFGWKGGIIAPDMRKRMMETPLALLEKCIIYDGGARRYEIRNHIEEVCEYWNGLLRVAERIDFKAFIEEKIGYPLGTGYEEWLAVTCLEDSPENIILWKKEAEVLNGILNNYRLGDICRLRLAEFSEAMKGYIQ